MAEWFKASVTGRLTAISDKIERKRQDTSAQGSEKCRRRDDATGLRAHSPYFGPLRDHKRRLRQKSIEKKPKSGDLDVEQQASWGMWVEWIEDIAGLEALYGQPGAPALKKVANRLTPLYRRWIFASRFCVLSTIGPDGTDGSPRGDDGPVVTELDERRLALPDWRGNNRLDSLRNIVQDGRASLMFLVPGSNTIVRVNGRAHLTADAALRARFVRDGKQPATVIVVDIHEVYTQCARAPMRARLWTSGNESAGLPSVGDILAEASGGTEGGAAYDTEWARRAAGTMW